MAQEKSAPTKRRGKANPTHHRSGAKKTPQTYGVDKEYTERLEELEEAMATAWPATKRHSIFSAKWGVSRSSVIAYEAKVRAHWAMLDTSKGDINARRQEIKELLYRSLDSAYETQNVAMQLRGLEMLSKLEQVMVDRVEVTGKNGAPLQTGPAIIAVLEGRSEKDLLYYGEHGRFPEEDQ